jgi:hypothetical protein
LVSVKKGSSELAHAAEGMEEGARRADEAKTENETDQMNISRICLVATLGHSPNFGRRPTYQRAGCGGGIGRPGWKSPLLRWHSDLRISDIKTMDSDYEV